MTEVVNQQLTLSEAAQIEIERLRESGELGDGYRTSPTCYICCEDESREMVNKLLSVGGFTNKNIVEACGGINARRRDGGGELSTRLISADSVQHHKRNHFNVQEPAKAIARTILERRAAEAQMDFINGVGHAITPYAVHETVMALGYGKVLEGQDISVETTLRAARDLHEMTSRDQGQRQMAEVLATMNRIITAAQRYIPADQQAAFVAEVEGRQQMQNVLTERVEQAVSDYEGDVRKPRTFTAPSKVDERDAM